mmetsp:Transcript_10053/g.36719  ORF Transcript_10053/g.36719 Transcript_10053/m.36719 type:complete len:583 (-) Transcript_10053:336-2084(-)
MLRVNKHVQLLSAHRNHPLVELVASALAWLALYHLLRFVPRKYFGKLWAEDTTGGATTSDTSGQKEKQREKEKQKEIETSYDVRSKFVGMLHAVLSLYLACTALYVDWHELKGNTIRDYTRNTQRMVTVSAGFFLWDVGLCAMHYKTFGAGLLMHAFVCFLMYALATLFHVFHYYGCMFLLWESSTLFLHVKWALEQYDLKGSMVYICNGLAFMFVFFMVRIVLGNIVFYELYRELLPMLFAPGTALLFRMVIVCIVIGSVCLNLLNLFWLSKMLKFASKSLSDAGLIKMEWGSSLRNIYKCHPVVLGTVRAGYLFVYSLVTCTRAVVSLLMVRFLVALGYNPDLAMSNLDAKASSRVRKGGNGGAVGKGKSPDTSTCQNVVFYEGTVKHARHAPTEYSFHHPHVRLAYVNLDKPPVWFAGQAKDHSSAAKVREIVGTTGEVWLLTTGKTFGFSQSPISVYYCYESDSAGAIAVVKRLVEVTNTPWGERVQFVAPISSSLSSLENGSNENLPSHTNANGDGMGNLGRGTRTGAADTRSNGSYPGKASVLGAASSKLVPKCLHVSPFMDMVSLPHAHAAGAAW